jgi:beta-mannosidase
MQFSRTEFSVLLFVLSIFMTMGSPIANGFKIALSSDKVARAVYLSGLTDGFFADNYFDLMPGKTVEVEFRAEKKMNADESRRMLKARSLIDAFE